MLRRLRKRLGTVTDRFPALERLAASLHRHAAAAVKAVGRRGSALFERDGKRDDLKCGARLVGIRNGLVAPLGKLRVFQHLRRGVRIGGRIDLRLDVGGDALVVVEIKVSERRHRQNCARIRIHDDSGGAVLYIKVLHRLGKLLLQIVLDGGIDCQVEIESVLRIDVVLIACEDHIRSCAVLQPEDASGGSGQELVLRKLQSRKAGIVRADEADDMRGERSIRVIALGIRLELHALQVVLVFKGAYRVRLGFLDLALDGFVPAVPVGGHREDLFAVYAEDLGKTGRNALGVLAVYGYLRGAHVHGIRCRAHRKHAPLAVIDRPARGGDRRAAELLLQGGALQLVVAQDLQPEKLEHQYGKRRNAARGKKEQRAAEHGSVGSAVGRHGVSSGSANASF